jgi:N-carbamoyl-L-amino-acid hydrolase
LNPDQQRIERDINELADIRTPDREGCTRIAFSEEDRRARAHVARLMESEAGLAVRVDAAGNLIGRREGSPGAAAIIVGSHLDTVPAGGRFDGIAGVVAGLEIARRLQETGTNLCSPLEVTVFAAEEPSPFGMSTIGSRAMAGSLPPEHLESLTDGTGRTLAEAIAFLGGSPRSIHQARRSPEEILAAFELHVEQGRSLFDRQCPVGVVTGIAGIHRGRVSVTGRGDHAGTTRMDERRDALAAAAECVLVLERICREQDGVVGTFGTVELSPNASNVVPAKVELGLDLRSLDRSVSERVVAALRESAAGIARARGVTIDVNTYESSPPVQFRPSTVQLMGRVCKELGITHCELPSGAGHDMSHIAGIAPTGMVFVPSWEGRSHCPEEWTNFEDIRLGTQVLGATVIDLDREEAQP